MPWSRSAMNPIVKNRDLDGCITQPLHRVKVVGTVGRGAPGSLVGRKWDPTLRTTMLRKTDAPLNTEQGACARALSGLLTRFLSLAAGGVPLSPRAGCWVRWGTFDGRA